MLIDAILGLLVLLSPGSAKVSSASRTAISSPALGRGASTLRMTCSVEANPISPCTSATTVQPGRRFLRHVHAPEQLHWKPMPSTLRRTLGSDRFGDARRRSRRSLCNVHGHALFTLNCTAINDGGRGHRHPHRDRADPDAHGHYPRDRQRAASAARYFVQSAAVICRYQSFTVQNLSTSGAAIRLHGVEVVRNVFTCALLDMFPIRRSRSRKQCDGASASIRRGQKGLRMW